MSARVGILSDTHGLMRPKVLEILKTCDYVLHAGDFTEEKILDQIRFLGTLYAVRGNSDGYWAQKLAWRQQFQIEGLKFLMVHDRQRAGGAVREADVIISGHTHRYAEEMADGKLWLNPGTCGWPRFPGEVSMAVMEVDGRDFRVERIML